jgi:hypothetical protein
LGDTQWKWLKEELKKKADLRLIAASFQFSSAYHGYENWSLFPHQRNKMLDIIKEVNAEHVFFISGDMHYSEVSKLHRPDVYPIYDLTASSINQSWPPEVNTNRVANNVYSLPNVGMIDIDWLSKCIYLSVYDDKGNEQFKQKVAFDEMEFSPSSNNDVELEIAFQQVPNPGQESVIISCTNPFYGNMTLYDSIGRMVNSRLINGESKIEFHNLTKGIYNLIISDKKSNKVLPVSVQ